VPKSDFPAAPSGECRRAANVASVASTEARGFGRIRLGATLDIRGMGPEAARNAYRRQSAWEEDPVGNSITHKRDAHLMPRFLGSMLVRATAVRATIEEIRADSAASL